MRTGMTQQVLWHCLHRAYPSDSCVACRVQHDDSRGPFKGGLRFAPDVDLDEGELLVLVLVRAQVPMVPSHPTSTRVQSAGRLTATRHPLAAATPRFRSH